ncbi:MAG TPA: hypothetical protein DDX40_10770, partial [Rikenellaceae bacterium]|nr:hypothetical protein [Rikenellaceae bacterium]
MHYIRPVLMLILLMSCLSSLAGARRALVIGIGTYEDPEWIRIGGDRDVRMVVEMLKRNSFHDIVTLEQKEATKSAIVGEFKALAERCAEGDTVYIHFS